MKEKIIIKNQPKLPEITIAFPEKYIPLYNFIMDASKFNAIPYQDIVLAAIENYIWFTQHLANGETFYVEKETPDGTRHRRKIKIGKDNNE